MPKLTNFVLAAMLASPFVIRYLRKRRLLEKIAEKPVLETEDFEEKEENEQKAPEEKEYFIRIPRFAVAAVIGKRGANLRNLMYQTQTDCVIRSYTPEELDVAEYFTTDGEWMEKFQTDDWFMDENDETAASSGQKVITYLMVRTADEKKMRMVRLRISEIIEEVKQPWKTNEFLVDSHMVGYLVGRGGRNIKNLRDKFNVQIQISEPIPENPEKSTVHIKGRDLTAMKEVEIVMKETVLPKNYNKIPRFDEDTLIENGIYEDVEKELEDLKKAGDLLSRGFY